MPAKPDRPAPASLTSGRFPWARIDQGPPDVRASAEQQAGIARWIIQQMTQQGISQRELARTGIASQSAISGLLTGRSWTDLWVVTRLVAHPGGRVAVRNVEPQ